MNYVRNNKSQDSRILGFFILYFHQSMKSRHPRVVPSPAMSSIVPCTLFFKMEQAKVFFLWTPFYSVSNSATRDQYWTSFRSSGQAASSCEGLTASCPKWHRGRWGWGYTFISNLVVFMFVNVKSWRGSTEKDCTGRLLGDLKLWQPRAGLHRCHEEVSSSVSFK